MKISFRNKILLPVVGGIILYILLCIWGDIDQLKIALANFQLGWLPLILMLSFSNYILRFLKFYYYLCVLGISLKVSTAFFVFLASFVMAITPGKLGEVLKSVFLKDLTGVPKSRTAPIVIAERITDLLALILILLIGVSGFMAQKSILLAVLLTLLIIILFCVLIGDRKTSLNLLAKLSMFNRLEQLCSKLQTVYESTSELITPTRLFWAVVLSVPAWSCEVIAFYYVCYGLGHTLPIESCFFIYSVATILGAIAFLPGGLGLTEASMAGLLTQVMCWSNAYAVSATLLIRVCTLWFAVLLGGLVCVLFQRQLGGQKTWERVEED